MIGCILATGGAIALVVGGLTALASVGTAVYQAREGRKQQRRAEAQQRESQKESLLAAAGEERRARAEERKANRKKPNLSQIMFDESLAGLSGPSSTILSGNSNGSRSLLGGGSRLGG